MAKMVLQIFIIYMWTKVLFDVTLKELKKYYH